MKKRLKLTHNLEEVELETYLEKALKEVKKYQEPNRNYPDKIAEKVMEESSDYFNRTVSNMITEIQRVVNKEDT